MRNGRFYCGDVNLSGNRNVGMVALRLQPPLGKEMIWLRGKQTRTLGSRELFAEQKNSFKAKVFSSKIHTD